MVPSIPLLSPSQVQWWSAQSIRFFLRWPSPYLCHVSNKLRQISVAPLVAFHLSSSLHQQRALLAAMREGSTAVAEGGKTATTDYPAEEAEALGSWEVDPARGMEGSVWPWQGHSGCGCSPHASASGNDQMSVAGADSDSSWGLGCKDMGRAVAKVSREAYMPRPIVGMHVGQGGKAREARKWPLAVHMLHLLRLRRKDPLLRFVWLSAETQVTHGWWGWKGWKGMRMVGAECLRVWVCARFSLLHMVGGLFACGCDCDRRWGRNWGRRPAVGRERKGTWGAVGEIE